MLAATSCTCALRLLTAPDADLADATGPAGPVNGTSAKKWGVVIDLNRCRPGCTACLDACRRENNVAFHGDTRWDIHWIRKVRIRSNVGASETEKSVILLCNHCEKPPCAQVCPVQATSKRDDGIVIVDHHRCIGCRYCMIACPYNARFFNFKNSDDWPNKEFPRRSHGVAEACNLCVHRLDRGRAPACVDACNNIGAGVLFVGDLNDPGSEVTRLVTERPVKRIREDLGTDPKVYYIGL